MIGGEILTLSVVLVSETEAQPQDIPLNIVYEDEHLLVLNKPAGLVVHPGAGNPDGTLLNALLFHCPELQNIPRAGLVHRIDKDTSGLLVVESDTCQNQKYKKRISVRYRANGRNHHRTWGIAKSSLAEFCHYHKHQH